jgi:hypothetical protein
LFYGLVVLRLNKKEAKQKMTTTLNKKIIEILPEHSCGNCTACCDGWLSGEAHGIPFYSGRKCNFVSENGCVIYSERPNDPCKTFHCEWLLNKAMPEWMRPDKSKVILVNKEINGIKYLRMTEVGEKVDSSILSWVLQACLPNNVNLLYEIDKGPNYFGSQEFINAMSNKTA